MNDTIYHRTEWPSYVTERRAAKGKRGNLLQVASLNRELQVLRRMFHLAQEVGQSRAGHCRTS